MTSNFNIRTQLFVFLAVNCVCGEEYNLFGEPGQGYAVQVDLGHPHQKLNLIVDTGSTTLAVASHPQPEGIGYFHSENSSSVYYIGKTVHAKYSQSNWEGKLVSDLVHLPSLPSVPEVRTELALITESTGFFANKTQWQGLLGLAYLPVGATGDEVIVESWLDSIEHFTKKPISFLMKLCGIQNHYNATHYGKFQIIGDASRYINPSKTFKTPVLRRSWYEVGVLSIKILYTDTTHQGPNSTYKYNKTESDNVIATTEVIEEICSDLNKDMSIVDSGTTNIRLPDVIFRQLRHVANGNLMKRVYIALCQSVITYGITIWGGADKCHLMKVERAQRILLKVVDELRNAAQASDMIILDEFWYRSEAACWPEPQDWHLPWLAIDLLSAEADNQYFTLEIPPQNYMRLVSADNRSRDSETLSEFCYKLGLDAGGASTVLGYTAMEGFEVLFNRSAGWISWQTSDCGPKTHISGPFNHTSSLITLCQLTAPVPIAIVSVKTAQWALCAMSIIAASVLVYLLAPCVKSMLAKKLQNSTQISLSQAALVAQESS